MIVAVVCVIVFVRCYCFLLSCVVVVVAVDCVVSIVVLCLLLLRSLWWLCPTLVCYV